MKGKCEFASHGADRYPFLKEHRQVKLVFRERNRDGWLCRPRERLTAFQEFSDFLFQPFLKPRFTPHISTLVLPGMFLYLFFANLAHGIPMEKPLSISGALLGQVCFY